MSKRIRALPKAALILTGCIIMASAVYAVTLQHWPLPPSPETASEQSLAPVAQRAPLSTIVTRPVMVTWGDLELVEHPMEQTAVAVDRFAGHHDHHDHPDYPGHPDHSEHLGRDRAASVRPPRLLAALPAERSTSGVMARFTAPPRQPVAARRSNLPAILTRDDVYRVMTSIRRAVQQCYDTGMVPGEVNLTLTVAGQTGRVRKANVSETSSTATCILRLARTLRFPRFARESITIQYPYLFK